LYGESKNPLLPPGHRSAVFHIQSSAEKHYSGTLSLHFFYLNVGTEGHPWPVRVEIPEWVAKDKVKLDLLHCVFIEQCKMMGSKPYPYLLHRAHEVAVVSHQEKQQVEQMLVMELRHNEEEIGDGSYKQSTISNWVILQTLIVDLGEAGRGPTNESTLHTLRQRPNKKLCFLS
jgi:hypothetical protein